MRAREIALRKIAGAKRGQIIAQFLAEAVLTALVSLVIAVALAQVLLPVYDRFLAEPITFGFPANWRIFGAICGGAIVAGLVSGFYPALVLSALKPASALESGRCGHRGSGLVRSILVLCQFSVAIGLGVAVIVVFRQISFARNMNLGYDRYHLIVVRGSGNLPPAKRERLQRILRAGPGIAGTALSSATPFYQDGVVNLPVASEGDPRMVTTQFFYISPSFPAVYRMRLLAGRFLSARHATDAGSGAGLRNVLINARAARRFGYSLTKALGGVLEGAGERLRVVGVVGNIITGGFANVVQPEIFLESPRFATLLTVRVRGGELHEALAYLDRTWHSMAPDVALDRYFFTDRFNRLFATERKTGAMLAAFVGLALLIACLGLFGLVVFTAERRTLEIGIRKVAGASTRDVMKLMLWRISVPVMLANAIAWPIAWYYLRHWLDGYAHRISLDPFYFLAAGAAALLIAWTTVFLHTLRLARTSPVHALRHE